MFSHFACQHIIVRPMIPGFGLIHVALPYFQNGIAFVPPVGAKNNLPFLYFPVSRFFLTPYFPKKLSVLLPYFFSVVSKCTQKSRVKELLLFFISQGKWPYVQLFCAGSHCANTHNDAIFRRCKVSFLFSKQHSLFCICVHRKSYFL